MADSTPSARLDLMTDLACVLLSAAGGMLLLVSSVGAQGAGWIPGPAPVAFGVDAGIGVLASATALVPATVAGRDCGGAGRADGLVAVRSARQPGVGLQRQPPPSSGDGGRGGLAHQLAFIGFSLLWITYPLWAAFLWVLSYHVTVVALGMYAGARRGLVASLREQIRQTEEAQQLIVGQARRAERAAIAVEMHDVLAHRVSLMALQAGALEVRPDLPPEEVRKTAGLIRSTARQAMTELRDIIGVLHDGGHVEAPLAPQPTLRDIAPLVDGYRKAGLKVRLDMSVDESGAVPGPLGRDAYRIVREALTNVSKHAGTTAAAVSLSGGAGEGLRVEVRNKLPVSGVLAEPAGELAGSGLGLVGLAERVALAGGTLAHGPDDSGDFALTAAFPWQG